MQPQAKQIPHVWHRPTGDTPDPWAWLRDRDDPDTIAYLEAENAWSAAWFAGHQHTVDAIFREIKSRILESDESPPVRRGEWWYSSRTVEGSDYPIHCRGESAYTATEEVILDENAEAAGHEFFALSAFDVNHDQTMVAWSSDTDGSEHYTLRVRDIGTGVDLPDELTSTTWAGTAWSTDGRHLFYVTDDEQQRPHRVWRHELGTPQSDDVLVFEDADERFYVGVDQSRSGEWIIIETHSKVTSEVWLLAADRATESPACVRRRVEDVEYSVDHWGQRFVVVTNVDHVDFAVMTAPLGAPGEWSALVPGVDGRRIVSAEPFAGHLVVHEWADAQLQMRIVRADGTSHVLVVTSEPHDVELEPNPEYDTTVLRYSYQSMTTPATIVDHDVDSGSRVIVKQVPVLGVDLSAYTSRREWATAPDGTRVPVDVVARVGTAAGAPTCVYAYGSYESSLSPWFSVARLSFLDRGGVFALAHPRGGGEFGRRWYLDGKLLNKRNTFTDTIAAAEHLVAAGIADPRRIAVRGGSAGGLLVGACVTMRPALFAAAIAEVPFVDVVTTMSDPSLPLTVTEWEEWGDPRTEPYASYMLGYSPYDNTRAAHYPAMYVTAGLNDPRVSYHEPAKWVAKLRSVRTNDSPLLLHCEMGAGHAGPSGRYDAWRDEARTLTFLLAALDASPEAHPPGAALRPARQPAPRR